jgi:8-oxo-dGTP pyrophosphatase MutT (NUDIX family)
MKNYKIFYNQAVLSITRFEQYNQTAKQNKNCYTFDDFLNLEWIIADFLTNEKSVSILYKDTNEENSIWNNIKNFFIFQQAAGGLIIKNKAILSIFRYNCWDFPKGHVESGETDEEAAIREVTEETGIDKLFIDNDLGYTYHIFPYKNHFALKETHWYKMRTDSDKTPVPQTEESILRAEWIPLKNIDTVLKNTYPTLVELIETQFRCS